MLSSNSVLEGKAKTMIMKEDHRNGDYNLAMQKLEKEYFNRHSFVKELSTQLELLDEMSKKDATKISEFYQEVKTITDQLRRVINDDNALYYQLGTSLYDKLNSNAKQKWSNLTLANQNKASHIGHNLKVKDFLNCIEVTKAEANFEDDFNQWFKLSKKAKDEKKEKEKEAKRAKELIEQKKKEAKMTEAYRFQTSQNEPKIKNQKKNCLLETSVMSWILPWPFPKKRVDTSMWLIVQCWNAIYLKSISNGTMTQSVNVFNALSNLTKQQKTACFKLAV